MQFQQTLRKSYSFEGKGLHTGKIAKMTVSPAPAGTGILFKRVDLGPDAVVEALAENVSNTARSTTISKGEVSVSTIEHIMSALTGMWVDNAIIEIDNVARPAAGIHPSRWHLCTALHYRQGSEPPHCQSL